MLYRASPYPDIRATSLIAAGSIPTATPLQLATHSQDYALSSLLQPTLTTQVDQLSALSGLYPAAAATALQLATPALATFQRAHPAAAAYPYTTQFLPTAATPGLSLQPAAAVSPLTASLQSTAVQQALATGPSAGAEASTTTATATPSNTAGSSGQLPAQVSTSQTLNQWVVYAPTLNPGALPSFAPSI